MAASRWDQANAAGILKSIVPMNDFEIVRFGEDGKYCLATENLNGCNAVAIVSRRAAILGHVAPMSPDPSSFPNADAWVQSFINRVLTCFYQNRAYYENQGAGGIVIYGMFDGQPGLPDQINILSESIQRYVGIVPQKKSYRVLFNDEEREAENANKGKVLVEGNASQQLPVIWVEDDRIQL
ncbi:MAG: hypothetical protein Q9222_001761 [Ikaeria aurantiellina]